ncbi:hypothetical protein BJ170DRAFT_141384 [Xylariales sp. AK1849]|nr:hypothetical protein BJ170DRAFT_141384 [Xylariales sp. AK1849]
MSAFSTRSSLRAIDDDIDAITPCPPTPCRTEAQPSPFSCAISDITASRSPSPSSCNESMSAMQVGAFEQRRNSVRTLEEGTEGDPKRLWRRMLALQQIYGCYKSARMSAALESGDISSLLPSKACLDLLNDGMEALPDEAEEALRKTVIAKRFRRRRSS